MGALVDGDVRSTNKRERRGVDLIKLIMVGNEDVAIWFKLSLPFLPEKYLLT